MAQQVQDSALALLWPKFDPWSGTSVYHGSGQKKKEKNQMKCESGPHFGA